MKTKPLGKREITGLLEALCWHEVNKDYVFMCKTMEKLVRRGLAQRIVAVGEITRWRLTDSGVAMARKLRKASLS